MGNRLIATWWAIRVIDDALGFTDSDRLTRMGAVFDSIGDGQVIVLTCSPARYRSVAAASYIELSA